MDVRRLQDGDLYGRQPIWHVDSWAHLTMSDAEKSMVMVAVRQCCRKTWEFELSHKEWMRLAGVQKSAFHEALPRLEAKGVVTTLNKGTRGSRRRYRLPPDPPEQLFLTPIATSAAADSKVRAGAPKRPPRRTHNRRSKEEREVKTAAAKGTRVTIDADAIAKTDGSAAAAGVEELKDALLLAGIGSAWIDELARLPLTPQIVREVAASCRAKGKGPPIIAQELRDRAERIRRRPQQAARAAQREAQDVARRRIEEHKAETEWEQLSAALEALDNGELAAHAAAVKQQNPSIPANADPRTHRGLRLLIADRLEISASQQLQQTPAQRRRAEQRRREFQEPYVPLPDPLADSEVRA